MLSASARRAVQPVASTSLRSAQTFKAFYATIRSLREPSHQDGEDTTPSDKDFIMSILRANPSLRDTKTYLASFGPRPAPIPARPSLQQQQEPVPVEETETKVAQPAAAVEPRSPVVASILNPIQRHTALVKIQSPFTDRQLESIAKGMVYLGKLGLVSVIVIENDAIHRGEHGERSLLSDEVNRVVDALEKQGAKARPVHGAVVRLGPKPGEEGSTSSQDFIVPEAHTFPSDLVHIRSALRASEIPVLAPFAVDSFCRTVRIDANDAIAALVRGMAEAAEEDRARASQHHAEDVDLTPLRLMIINKEGGVPSYARGGLPHLLINLASEYSYINNTYDQRWRASHPTALSNLSLARTCLNYMPPSSSAVMVSHRSPSSLIGNLITNRPAVSSSLPHALLQGKRTLTPHTPTLLRRGLDVRVLRSVAELDRHKLKTLLEQSFRRTLDEDPFWARLEKSLDYVIVSGDYAGAAIVTREVAPSGHAIAYLDKFAVAPNHQGDGTVDFLWVALHDESYGLGLPFSANPNGGKEGDGEGTDLVWRSRADNPVNKWYFERSTGHLRMGSWVLFWCDAEMRLKTEEGRRANAGLSYLEAWERGRLAVWTDVVPKIPSSWRK